MCYRTRNSYLLLCMTFRVMNVDLRTSPQISITIMSRQRTKSIIIQWIGFGSNSVCRKTANTLSAFPSAFTGSSIRSTLPLTITSADQETALSGFSIWQQLQSWKRMESTAKPCRTCHARLRSLSQGTPLLPRLSLPARCVGPRPFGRALYHIVTRR